ncbi:hypothetical protein BJ138DRAFT_1012992 [Hygrophoropsis aurantiaca]|uniref:Uncharacterized protein n=1 Tax=Hygrophoropsis aurantiaca TaxID=72124 RepID=A0ACB8A6Q5_9AGAM|nr:hypothetical protein BJ138DRAFT_1012992 [Hygrophoropsis aurantiaca]
MTQRREALFPSGSIGRVQGASIARSASRESLSAHPLASTSEVTVARDISPGQKYVPYTPRQRITTTTTTSTPATTSKAQTVNAKAAAASIGVDTGSLGMAMVDKLTSEGEEWGEIWTAITKGGASLLLPLEHVSVEITPQLVRDHVVFTNTQHDEHVSVLTMSGLRGQLVNSVLTFRSTLSPASKSPRATLLSTLPPQHTYPSYTISAHAPSLPLPQKPAKPPLPPRPPARPASAQPSSRLSMPFASLFGQRPATPPTSTTPLPPHVTADADHPIEIAAYTIDRHVSFQHVAHDIISALSAEIAADLAQENVPPHVVDKVQAFAACLRPFVRAPLPEKKKLHDIGAGKPPYVVNTLADGPDDIGERFQEFYAQVEDDLRAGEDLGNGDDNDNDQATTTEEERKEVRIREILECVERTLCTLFYDRLFLPSSHDTPHYDATHADDATHDAALSSRVAALNMLDLRLEHLGVDLGDNAGTGGEGVEGVVRACGQMLSQLDATCRAPGDKAAVLVAAHKVVIDGLSKLPPIRLKTGDDEPAKPTHPHSEAKTTHPEAEAKTTPEAKPAHDHSAPTEDIPIPIVASPDTIGPPIPLPLPVPLLVEPSTHMDADADADADASQSQSRSAPNPTLASTSTSTTSNPSPATNTTPTPASNAPTPTPTHTPISTDLLLPLIIYAVVRANPPRLVSHLLFTQRFRNRSPGLGEETFCLINLLAVAEFLENVDLAALGLEDAAKVMSTAELAPIPIVRADNALNLRDPLSLSLPGRIDNLSLRGRVDNIAGSANKVISGVVDSSFGVLRSLLPGDRAAGGVAQDPNPHSSDAVAIPPAAGLVRRESGFSIGSFSLGTPGGGFSLGAPGSILGASLPGKARSGSVHGGNEEEGRQLVAVSRPGSVRDGAYLSERVGEEGDEEGGSEEDVGEDEGEGDEEAEGADAVEGETQEPGSTHDARSIRSFESMMGDKRAHPGSNRRRKHRQRLLGDKSDKDTADTHAPKDKEKLTRKSLTDRLASVPGLGRLSGDTHRDKPTPSLSLPQPPPASLPLSVSPPIISPPPHPSQSFRLPPPNRRFLECEEGDLKVSEVGALLRAYRELVQAVEGLGAGGGGGVQEG